MQSGIGTQAVVVSRFPFSQSFQATSHHIQHGKNPGTKALIDQQHSVGWGSFWELFNVSRDMIL